MPAISVLMPVWNACSGGKEQYFRLAVESVVKQTFKDWELWVVDDGSTDNTISVYEELREKYDPNHSKMMIMMQKHQKIVAALNNGLRHCTAPLVARMDADDISVVTRLEIQKDFLDNRLETAMCGTGMYHINHEGKLLGIIEKPCNHAVIRQALKSGCPFVHGSVMFRKSAVLDLGGYSSDPAYDIAEDYELWVRLAAKHPIENIPDKILYYHRSHPAKSSNVLADVQRASTQRVMQKANAIL